MTDGATFNIQLEDNVSFAATQQENALKSLKSAIEADTAALKVAESQLKSLSKATSIQSKEFQDMARKVVDLRAKVGLNRRAFANLGGTVAKAPNRFQVLGKRVSDMGAKLSQSGGAAAAMGGSLSRLGALIANPVGAVVALTVAVLALSAAMIAGIAVIARYAVAQSNARREEALRLEGLNSLRQQFGRVTDSVENMQSAIDRASDATGLGRQQLEGYTRQLTRVGFRGEALAQALEGTALAASVQGERGARRFRAMAINAALTGRSVRDLADDYRRRLGPIARRQMLSLDNQSRRLRMGLERIFSGLRIETFLGAINEITDQFSQTTASGRALKALVEGLFQPLLDATEGAGPILRRFFQGMVIAALQLGIMFLRLRNAIRDAFGDQEILSNQQLMNAALIAGQVVVFGLAAAFLAFVTVAALVAAWMAFIVATAVAIPAALVAIAAGAAAATVALLNLIEETDFEELGRNMIQGLIRGIRSAQTQLTNTVRGLANSASQSFRSALGISSPSTVFAGFGANIAQGVTRGVNSEQSAVNDAVGGLVQAPTGGGISTTNATTISVGDVMIQAGETTDARELAEQFRDQLASVLEGISIEVGATA